MAIAKDIDEYIAAFPKEVQKRLQQMRKIIQKAAPQAEETINYAMPTFTLNGNLVHFAGYANHIGFYPTPSGIEAFKKELSLYKGAKGSVQFPLDEPLPLDLITKIVEFRVAESVEKAAKKKTVQPSATKTNVDTKKSTAKAVASKQKESGQNNLFTMLSAPAQRALNNAGINSLKKLAQHSEKEILILHGMGPSSIPKLKNILQAEGLAFKK